jgi:glycosyltransferase involved in cell wall biosynthesis
MNKNSRAEIVKHKIAYVSSYPPRECGIATFTKNLIVAINKLGIFRKPSVIAMNEKETIYNYDRMVKYQIRRDFPEDYVKAASYVNSSKADLVNLQHEFGLFGREGGELINSFLEKIQKPVVTTLHTLSPSFEPQALTIFKQVLKRSSKIVTMTKIASKILMMFRVLKSKLSNMGVLMFRLLIATKLSLLFLV